MFSPGFRGLDGLSMHAPQQPGGGTTTPFMCDALLSHTLPVTTSCVCGLIYWDLSIDTYT